MIQILNYEDVEISAVFGRTEERVEVSDVVSGIIRRVKAEKDRALFELTKQYDGAALSSLRVSEAERKEGEQRVDPRFLSVLRQAADNIRSFHSRQVRGSFIINETDGVVLGQKVLPLDRVGLYVPGGTAAYPSTVLMDAIPAKLAGVRELAIATPPRPDGSINPVILAAAGIAGVDRIYKLGGAQAIAALAYGTESIAPVDKIVGPGNVYVAEAKRQVYGKVAIDMIAGPSEILIVADGASNPRHVAADLLSQAEHDRLASAVLVTDSKPLARRVQQELEVQIPLLRRSGIARESIDANGKIIVTDSLRQAIDMANTLAPEHLELMVDAPFDLLSEVRNAGSVFLGRSCPEALGDYLAGPNHTLPTMGSARFSSPLSVDDFVKKTQFTYYSADALGRVAGDVAFFAEQEGLTGHARSALIRVEDNA